MLVSKDGDPRRAGTIWTFALHEAAPVIRPLIKVDFQRLVQEQAAQLARAPGAPSLAEIEVRFENDRRCYAAWLEGTPVAYGWVSFNSELVGELRLKLSLKPEEAYIWDCATSPVYRRKHLYSALLAAMLEDLRIEGYARAWIGADQENVISQRGFSRAGFQHVADLLIARFMALRMMWLQPADGADESQVADARRVFLGDRQKLWMSAVTR